MISLGFLMGYENSKPFDLFISYIKPATPNPKSQQAPHIYTGEEEVEFGEDGSILFLLLHFIE